MSKVKMVIDFLKGFGKFVFTTMAGKVFMWGSVILLGVSKLITVLMDIAFETEFGKNDAKNNTSTDTEN